MMILGLSPLFTISSSVKFIPYIPSNANKIVCVCDSVPNRVDDGEMLMKLCLLELLPPLKEN